jgi:hypothetical protein
VTSKSTLEREVFPVRLRANRTDTWLAWETPDGPAYFWATEEGVLYADSLSGLLEEIDRIDAGASVGCESYFDLDGALRCIRERAAVDPELMIDIWNLLTDLSRTFSGTREIFRADLSDTYDVYFSRCEVAEFVGLGADEVSAANAENASEVLEEGLVLIAAATRGR